MSSKRVGTTIEMVAFKNKNKVLCSTPEHKIQSPSRDSDSLCDSDAASPVPFLCTQDGTEGETDVVWNHYTPKSGTSRTQTKNRTPLSRRSKKTIKPKILDKPIAKRKTVKPLHRKNELLQELFELNQNLQDIIGNTQTKTTDIDKQDLDEAIFNNSSEFSPKCGIRNKSCLRKNVLSSKFPKPEPPENGLESDDSMNECLLRASQMVEEKILNNDVPKKRPHEVVNKKSVQSVFSFKMDQDSMDAILNSIKLDSPVAKRVKKCDSPKFNNDSFDSFFGNLNDSALEKLTQIPTKNNTPVRWPEQKHTLNSEELEMECESPFTKSIFGRHNSMPESPSVTNVNKPSTSGMVFGRYNSMPVNQNDEIELSDSPIRCTPDEIKKKHQLAREKLLAKRQLPFTTSQYSNHSSQITQQTVETKKSKFQPKVPSNKAFNVQKTDVKQSDNVVIKKSTSVDTKPDIKTIIEKKRQEALMKLRLRKQTNT